MEYLGRLGRTILVGVVLYILITLILYAIFDSGHGFWRELLSPFRLCFFLPLDILIASWIMRHDRE